MAIIEVNGVEIFYKKVGEGIPCLMMHGGLGVDHNVMHPWLDGLGEKMELVYYDHRGNGKSTPVEANSLTHEVLLEDAKALASALGYEKFAILGHSYGGFLGLEFALKFPERVTHLILVDTAAAFDYFDEILENAKKKGATEEMIEAIIEEWHSDEEFEKGLKTFFPLYFKNYDENFANKMVENIIMKYSGMTREGELAGFDVRNRLGEIEIATLVLVGEDDFITPASKAETIHAGIPNSEMHIFENSGHFPFIEEKEAFFQAVFSWLDK
ncbi:MAG: alpha/beta fold hydrolase [Chloroflexi bacterium]|jgi:proline iminopeptidase|nr:alpha/beta fold hydrolase [Chloroflexota bacterium]MBT4002960.1 alpha/beta fold hydrolase [Chloroflexota bacterium]MBT4305792.1 alpha/beta fold hydrolase [Chloroflexota bacterium]MBT4533616.1 alpha/beta fold hydrolase [Chloroflexota bacterium]MBT4681741.1 alpha/beta fold hydrolase [Chloroflexota bacterium]